MEDGADIVIHSLSKWIGGHGAAMGGVVIDSGKFDWKASNVPLFTEPDANYHGLRWAQDLPAELAPIAFALRFRTVPLRNLGACLSPDNAWIFLIGCETLHVRMERHSQNGLAAAKFLKNHPEVAWVRYPGLEEDPAYPVAKKQLKNGSGGMVVFGIKAGNGQTATERGRQFIEHLKLFSHVSNVGDAKSLATHPASTTHSQMSEEEQRASGLQPELVRLSIGIEHIDDILGDLEQALAR
jgi:O-acetylhomoserine (thiol)-lyase